MKNTLLITLASAGLSAPLFAGSPTTPVINTLPAVNTSALSGSATLLWQDQYSYRGLSDTFYLAGRRSTSSKEAFAGIINAQYTLNNEFTLVGSAYFGTVRGIGADHLVYSAGIRWNATDQTYAELGYNYQVLDLGGFDEQTSEVYVKLGTVCPLTGANLSLLAVQDIDYLEGYYVELSGQKNIRIFDRVSLDVTLGIAAQYDLYTNSKGLSHAFATVALPLAVTENLVVSPYVSYTQTLSATNHDFGDQVLAIENDEFFAGIKAQVKF